MRGIFPGCWAPAKLKHARITAPTTTEIICFFIITITAFYLPVRANLKDGRNMLRPYCWLFNDPTRPRQHIGRDRYADLLGGFQVDDEIEFHRLLHRQLRGFGTLDDLVDENCRTAK